MTDEPRNPEEHNHQAASAEEPVVDTWYDDEETKDSGGQRWNLSSLNLCEIRERMEDRVLKTVPVEVTEHLANSRKELFLAGIALAESGIRKADATVQRARDLNTPKPDAGTAT